MTTSSVKIFFGLPARKVVILARMPTTTQSESLPRCCAFVERLAARGLYLYPLIAFAYSDDPRLETISRGCLSP